MFQAVAILFATLFLVISPLVVPVTVTVAHVLADLRNRRGLQRQELRTA